MIYMFSVKSQFNSNYLVTFKMFLPVFICVAVLVNISWSSNPRPYISFKQFNRYHEITSYLQRLEETYPQKVKIEHMGKSYNQREIPCIRISSDLNQNTRPMILIDAGIHAREWIAPAVALYIINELVKNDNRHMIENVDWLIIPLLNPDGYEYTHTTDRMWRKNRSKGNRCYGVDLNRNFDFHFMEQDSSSDECSYTYAGPRPFSEPETIAFKNLASKFKTQIKLYITFHSYGVVMLYPWSYTDRPKPANAQEHLNLGTKVVEAIKQVRGTAYRLGSGAEIFRSISGVSDDWAKGVLGIPLTYTIELPAGGNRGFDPPPSAIGPIVTETFAGVKELHKYINQQ